MGLKSGDRDLRSGIRKKPIPDPGFKKALHPGPGSATLLQYGIKDIMYLGFGNLFLQQ
jgi:hypothetical protein